MLFWILLQKWLGDTSVIQAVVMGLDHDSIWVSRNWIIIASTWGQFYGTGSALNVGTEADVVESLSFHSIVILIIAVRPWCNHRLFGFSIPENKLLCPALWSNRPPLFRLRRRGEVLCGISLVSCVIEDFDSGLEVAGAPVTIIAMSEEAGPFEINSFKLFISFNIIIVWARCLLTELHGEQGTTLREFIFLWLHWMVEFLKNKIRIWKYWLTLLANDDGLQVVFEK